jgi:hypothetical protein
MPEIPAFLKDFIDHRKNITKDTKTDVKTLKTSVKKVDTLDTGVQTIIDKKVSKKAVEEYFQKKCDELSTEKMK